MIRSKFFEINAKDLSVHEVNAEIRNAVGKGLKVLVKNAKDHYGVAAGLKNGEVVIEGDVGDYLGMLNSGAKIVVNGNAGNYVGDGAWGGEIIVRGDVGYGTGIYAYGGTIVVEGNAGNAVGQVLKGATVLIKGNAGDNIGVYMVNGEIIIVGNAGKKLGDWMIRGVIYLGGECESFGHNTKVEDLTEDDIKKLETIFEKYGIKADPHKFKKIVPASLRPFYGK